MKADPYFENIIMAAAAWSAGCVTGWVFSKLLHSKKSPDLKRMQGLAFTLGGGLTGSVIYKNLPKYDWGLFVIGLGVMFFTYVLYAKPPLVDCPRSDRNEKAIKGQPRKKKHDVKS